LDTADTLSNLANKVSGGKRLNLDNAVGDIPGATLTLNPADDFDIYGYNPSESEEYELYAQAGDVMQAAGAW